MANDDTRKQMQDTARAAADMARKAGAQQAAVRRRPGPRPSRSSGATAGWSG